MMLSEQLNISSPYNNVERNIMEEFSVIRNKLDFSPQNLHLSIWKAKTTETKGIFVGFHGLASHGSLCFHYFGPYMAERGWTTVAMDMPGLGHWIPENQKAEKDHWSMNIDAVTCLVKFCKALAPNKKLILIGISMGVINITDYIFSKKNDLNALPDCAVIAVPCLHVSIPFYLYPIVIPLSIFAPNIKIGLKRFEPSVKSNDPNSIINNPDPLSLKRMSIGYAIEFYKSIRKLHLKRKYNPMDKWPKNIPLLIITAGQDEVVDTEYAHFFYHMLPQDICSQCIHYPRAHHYILYEDNRNEIFEDILQFLSKNI